MKYVKRSFCLLLACLCALTAVSCGGEEETAAQESVTVPAPVQTDGTGTAEAPGEPVVLPADGDVIP